MSGTGRSFKTPPARKHQRYGQFADRACVNKLRTKRWRLLLADDFALIDNIGDVIFFHRPGTRFISRTYFRSVESACKFALGVKKQSFEFISLGQVDCDFKGLRLDFGLEFS